MVWRIYDSRDLRRGDFGHGWTMELEGFGDVESPADPGLGWEDVGCPRFPFRATINELSPHFYAVHVGSRVYRFRLRMTGTGCITGAATVDASIKPLPGTSATMRTVGIATTSLLLLRDGSNRVLHFDFSTWTPSQYEMTTPDGKVYRLSPTAITRITDSTTTVGTSSGASTRSVTRRSGSMTPRVGSPR